MSTTRERPLPAKRPDPTCQAEHHPDGWHSRRHFKRKRLRRSYERFMAARCAGVKWMLLPAALCLLVLFIVLFGSTTYVQATQKHYRQQVTTLADILPKDNLKMYDKHGRLIYQMKDQGLQTTVPLSKIAPSLIEAEIATEDKTFYTNPGFDITAIVRAALADLSLGRTVSGASTITQQLVKNAIVGNQESVTRKLKEIALAPDITRHYTKEQILSMYLNTIYYGERAYGIDAAAFTYFDLQDTPTTAAASQLDLAQSAMLAGIPSAPEGHDPFVHPKAAYARLQDVLSRMQAQHYITPQQGEAALAEARKPSFLHHGVIRNDLAPHFAAYALNELAQDLHVRMADLPRSGLRVFTTLRLNLQNKMLQIARQHIAALTLTHHVTDASVVMINPHSGAIRVLLGNIDPNNPQYGTFDVATQGYRQPGSSFKPFVYVTAFERGVSPGTPVLDGPLSIPLCCGQPPYQPHNYDLRYHGLVPYRFALANSFNIPAVKLEMQTGVQRSLRTAQAMGITSYQGTPTYSMVLGSLGVHLLDETSAYSVFANQGVRVPPHAIDMVTDQQGNIIFRARPAGTQVITKQATYMIDSVLRDNTARSYEFGPCSPLELYSNSQTACYEGDPGIIRPAAAKTGTSNDFRDNWTVGYTNDYVIGVWAGNNDNSPMVNVIGITGAAPIWHDCMLLAEQGKPMTSFPFPGGLVKKTVAYPGITTTDWYLK